MRLKVCVIGRGCWTKESWSAAGHQMMYIATIGVKLSSMLFLSGLRTQFYKKLQRVADKIEVREIGKLYDEIIQHDNLSAEDSVVLQNERLREILIYASRNVPFYREIFSQVGFYPDHSFSLEDFYRLPFTSKELVKEKPQEFAAKPLDQLIPRKTGGSTGPKLTVYYDSYGLDVTAAIHRRCMSWTGKNIGDPECHLSSFLGEDNPWQDQLREFAKCTILNRKNVLIGIMDKDKWKKVVQEIKRHKPRLVQGFPSQAYQLALFIESEGKLKKPLFDIYESTGETLYDFQREKIQSVLGCEVFDRYGNAEFGVIAHECHCHSGLHIMSDIVLVEVIRDHHSKGQSEIVVTGLTNFGMPLIRYRTGDIGEIDNSVCACGLPYPRIVNMQGRVHDVIVLEQQGQTISTYVLLDIMDRCGGMDDFQFRQEDGLIQLYIKPDKDCNVGRLLEVQKRLAALDVKTKLRVNIDLVDELALSPAGKFRYMSTMPVKVEHPILVINNELGVIRDCTANGAFLRFGNFVLLQGFHSIETHGEYLSIWSSCNSEVIPLRQEFSWEILNLSSTPRSLTIERLSDGQCTVVEMLPEWHSYDLQFECNQVYRLSVEEEIAPEYKPGDSRELGFCFRLKRE